MLGETKSANIVRFHLHGLPQEVQSIETKIKGRLLEVGRSKEWGVNILATELFLGR